MDPRLLSQAADLLHLLVTQIHPEPCSLDEIESAILRAAHAAGRLAAEQWAQAVVGVAETTRPRCACGAEMTAERRSSRTLLLLVGLLRVTVRRFQCPLCQAWACPGAQQLGLAPRARLSRAVQEVIGALGLSWSYRAAAQLLARLLPNIAVSPKTVERVVKHLGTAVAAQETVAAQAVAVAGQAAARAAFLGEEGPAASARPPAGRPFEQPSRIYLGLDGILVRGRRKKEKLEIQVASFWSAWRWRSGCNPARREITDATFVARATGWEALGQQVWRWFVTRGGCRGGVQEVVVLGDGASGIRSLWELYFPQALALLDPWHLWEKVKQRAREVSGSRQRGLGLAQVVYRRLRRGALAEARELIEHWPAATAWAQQQRQRLLAYLERNADTIKDYETLRAAGYLVGSGLTEKANDLVVVPRMKNGKMHWSRAGAETVALLRAHVLNQPQAPILPT